MIAAMMQRMPDMRLGSMPMWLGRRYASAELLNGTMSPVANENAVINAVMAITLGVDVIANRVSTPIKTCSPKTHLSKIVSGSMDLIFLDNICEPMM